MLPLKVWVDASHVAPEAASTLIKRHTHGLLGDADSIPVGVSPLAPQGGGSHGAFTWGVLDRLLEDGRLAFDGITATSVKIVNSEAHFDKPKHVAEGDALSHQERRNSEYLGAG